MHSHPFTFPLPMPDQAPLHNKAPHVEQSWHSIFGEKVLRDIPEMRHYESDGQAWFGSVSTDSRLLVVLRCMNEMGFSTIGEFLTVLFSGHHTERSEVFQAVAAFFRARGRKGQRPADIVQMMFAHPKSKARIGESNLPPLSLLPPYAQPESIRFTPQSTDPAPECDSTQAALSLWALRHIIGRVENEASTLTDTYKMFGKLKWQVVTGWNMAEQKHFVASEVSECNILLKISANMCIRRLRLYTRSSQQSLSATAPKRN